MNKILVGLFAFLSVLLVNAKSVAGPDDYKVRIVLLDTGLDLNDPRFKEHLCQNGHKDFTGFGIEDHHGHGTHLFGIIERFAGPRSYCVIIVKYSHLGQFDELYQDYPGALKYAASLKPDVINMSLEGPDYMRWEKRVIEKNPNIKFVVAAGNARKDLDNDESYPASYNLPNMYIVGNMDLYGEKSFDSNYGTIVKYWEYGVQISSYDIKQGYKLMSGTSMSAASKSGKLIKELVDEKLTVRSN